MNKFKKRFENPSLYAEYEFELTNKYIIPRFKEMGIKLKGKKLLDIGCGWGGCSVAFAKQGCVCEGFDLSKHQLNIGKKFAASKKIEIKFFIDDICNPKKTSGKFDIIFLREVIEYLDRPFQALINSKRLLKDNGYLYVTLAPWYSPYGGHQHHPKSITRFMPFVQLLPKIVYFSLLKTKEGLMFKEDKFIKEIKKVRNNKISISEFEHSIKKSRLSIYRERQYISKPAFKIRMGLPIINAGFLGNVPLLREFITTGAEYFLRK